VKGRPFHYPDRPDFLPCYFGGTVSKGALARALGRFYKAGKQKRRLKSHGAGRAFYVLVRRSQGAKASSRKPKSLRTQDDWLKRVSDCELDFPNRWDIPTRIFANKKSHWSGLRLMNSNPRALYE
jgi:hypothetical protein